MAAGSPYGTISMTDFSGGWNPRDAWSQLAHNESPDCKNVTLDERGGLTKRLGLTKLTGQITNTANVQTLYYSQALDLLLAQVGTGLYKSSDNGANWSSIKTFSTSATCDMVDFLGKVVVVHPVDTCFTYDGTTFSGAIASSPKATGVAIWQNYIWTIGDPTDASSKTVVTRSDAGAHTWTSPGTLAIRLKDDQPLTAIGGGEGMDELGEPGLLVFKEESSYRITDPGTLSYSAASLNYGASNQRSITTTRGFTAAMSRRGIVVMRGDDTEPVYVSSKLEPLFSPDQLTMAQLATMCAGTWRERMFFSLAWNSSTTNNLTLEYDPDQGWFAPHSFGVTAFARYTKQADRLYGGKVGTAAASYGYVLRLFDGGDDDGSDISAYWQSRWVDQRDGGDLRFRRALVNGRGDFDLYVRLNYDTGQGEVFPILITGSGMVWGTGVWGVDSWGVDLQQDYQEVFSLGHGRSISIRVEETSSLSDNRSKLLGVGGAPEVGAFALYGVQIDAVSLGRS